MKIEQIWPGWIQEEKLGNGTFGTVYKIRKEQYGSTSYAAAKRRALGKTGRMKNNAARRKRRTDFRV